MCIQPYLTVAKHKPQRSSSYVVFMTTTSSMLRRTCPPYRTGLSLFCLLAQLHTVLRSLSLSPISLAISCLPLYIPLSFINLPSGVHGCAWQIGTFVTLMRSWRCLAASTCRDVVAACYAARITDGCFTRRSPWVVPVSYES